jgi:ATP synthase protein I
MSWIKNKSLNAALKAQIVVTVLTAIGVWIIYSSEHAAMSAMLGGLISVMPSGDAIRTALRAEAVKIILTIMLLWIAFRFYVDVNAIALVATFIMVVLTYSAALFVSEEIKR